MKRNDTLETSLLCLRYACNYADSAPFVTRDWREARRMVAVWMVTGV